MISSYSGCYLLSNMIPPVVGGGCRHDIQYVPMKEKRAPAVKVLFRPERLATRGHASRGQSGSRSRGPSATPSASTPPRPLSADGCPPRRSRPLRPEQLVAQPCPVSGRDG